LFFRAGRISIVGVDEEEQMLSTFRANLDIIVNMNLEKLGTLWQR